MKRNSPTSRWVSGITLGALAALGTACSDDDFAFRRDGRGPSDVNVVFDPDVDFSQYLTFALRDETENGGPPANEDPGLARDLALVDERIVAELDALGLIEVSVDEADLLAFSVGRRGTARGVDWDCVGGFWGDPWYWGYYYDPCAWLEADYYEIERTTLMVGLFDPALDDVPFAGFVRGIERGGRRGSRERQIVRAVARIFDRYPARPAPAPNVDAGTADPDAPDAGSLLPDGGPPDAEAPNDTADAGVTDAGAGDAAPPP